MQEPSGTVKIEPEEFVASGVVRWNPVIGNETELLRPKLPSGADDRIIDEARAILSRCAPAGGGEASLAGLVVGEVQSGKTGSFTTVAALARDNGFGLVILVAGTTTNLTDQSRDRLESDLGLSDAGAYDRWVHFMSPDHAGGTPDDIAAALEESLDPETRAENRSTVLISVMKNYSQLNKLAATLERVGERVDLTSLTALIIDDEADQATPNAQARRNKESTTYRALRSVRRALPCHTLLQYTATPQAPLLVALTDELSPEFVCVLSSGDAYTGGDYFFQQHSDGFRRDIPEASIEAALQAKDPVAPPELHLALATYLIGAAVARRTHSKQRSMLIHPSRGTDIQRRYVDWINSTRETWVSLLSDPSDPDCVELVDHYFAPAHADLSATVPDLPELNELLGEVRAVLRRTRVVEVNSTSGSADVAWHEAFSWILIGGQKLDRGFTVEGLTVTFMPRGAGVGNADTIEQRGRFFGYKASYAAYCRAWLSPDIADAFTSYVAHETAMRRELIKHAESGRSLKEWRRSFILDPGLKPTRSAVIALPLSRISLDDRWFRQQHVPLPAEPGDAGEMNSSLTDAFCAAQAWTDYPSKADWTDMQTHQLCTTTLNEIMRDYLVDYEMVDDDSGAFTTLLLGLESLAETEPTTPVTVIKMSSGAGRKRTVEPSSTRLKKLFQGRSRNGSYPGDAGVKDDHQLTIQIHRIDVHAEAGGDDNADDDVAPKGQLDRASVPVLAVWVPSQLRIAGIVGRD